MKDNLHVWIYCRVNNPKKVRLLDCQADLLIKYAKDHNYCISGLTKAIDDGNNMHSSSFKQILSIVEDEFIDAVLVFSSNRLFNNKEEFDDFKLVCLVHNVSIITYR